MKGIYVEYVEREIPLENNSMTVLIIKKRKEK